MHITQKLGLPKWTKPHTLSTKQQSLETNSKHRASKLQTHCILLLSESTQEQATRSKLQFLGKALQTKGFFISRDIFKHSDMSTALPSETQVKL